MGNAVKPLMHHLRMRAVVVAVQVVVVVAVVAGLGGCRALSRWSQSSRPQDDGRSDSSDNRVHPVSGDRVNSPAGDRDGDGLADTVDACPDEPEDKDGFQDDDGCPDADNDGDGIIDAMDVCPGEPEDKDGVDDGDGCPDP
jgi:hypothetical protein